MSKPFLSANFSFYILHSTDPPQLRSHTAPVHLSGKDSVQLLSCNKAVNEFIESDRLNIVTGETEDTPMYNQSICSSIQHRFYDIGVMNDKSTTQT